MGLRGDLRYVRELPSRLRAAPRTVAAAVAAKAAPALTTLTQQAFSGGVDVYGAPRPDGVDGQPLTLRRTGETERDLRFASTGTIVRNVAGPRYLKYLIGKYGVLPGGNSPIPGEWSRKIRALLRGVELP